MNYSVVRNESVQKNCVFRENTGKLEKSVHRKHIEQQFSELRHNSRVYSKHLIIVYPVFHRRSAEIEFVFFKKMGIRVKFITLQNTNTHIHNHVKGHVVSQNRYYYLSIMTI